MISQQDVFTEGEQDDRIVGDQERIRVPMILMDTVQRSVADTSPLTEEDARIAYEEYVKYISNRWRNPETRPQPPRAKFEPTGDARRDAYLEFRATLQDAWRNP